MKISILQKVAESRNLCAYGAIRYRYHQLYIDLQCHNACMHVSKHIHAMFTLSVHIICSEHIDIINYTLT